MNPLLQAGLLLSLKHFLADGPLQYPYQYINKGNIRHPGGYLHAGIHGFFTACIFKLTATGIAIGLLEAVVHYIIDWSKVNLTKRCGWSAMLPLSQIGEGPRAEIVPVHLAVYSDYYFWALMADQCLHFATYIVILWYVFQ
jgi:hypothetical protein